MPGIEGHHQLGLLHRQKVDALLLFQVGAVPGEDDVVHMMEQPRRQHIGGAAIKGDEHIGVPLMEPLHEH